MKFGKNIRHFVQYIYLYMYNVYVYAIIDEHLINDLSM